MLPIPGVCVWAYPFITGAATSSNKTALCLGTENASWPGQLASDPRTWTWLGGKLDSWMADCLPACLAFHAVVHFWHKHYDAFGPVIFIVYFFFTFSEATTKPCPFPAGCCWETAACFNITNHSPEPFAVILLLLKSTEGSLALDTQVWHCCSCLLCARFLCCERKLLFFSYIYLCPQLGPSVCFPGP